MDVAHLRSANFVRGILDARRPLFHSGVSLLLCFAARDRLCYHSPPERAFLGVISFPP